MTVPVLAMRWWEGKNLEVVRTFLCPAVQIWLLDGNNVSHDVASYKMKSHMVKKKFVCFYILHVEHYSANCLFEWVLRISNTAIVTVELTANM